MLTGNMDKWQELLSTASLGDATAQFDVAASYETGLHIDKQEVVKPDVQNAFSGTKQAYELGNKEEKISYVHYLTDRNNPIGVLDVELGMKLYEEEMNQGSQYAAYGLGLEYRNAHALEKAFPFYEKAHRHEEYFQESTIGMFDYYGIGVSKDKRKALEYFESNALPNVTPYEFDEANYRIGKIYSEGDEIAKDIEKARYHFVWADHDGNHSSAQEKSMVIRRSTKAQ